MRSVTHKDLDIWKMGLDVVEKVYRISERFPKDEQFGLTSQKEQQKIRNVNIYRTSILYQSRLTG